MPTTVAVLGSDVKTRFAAFAARQFGQSEAEVTTLIDNGLVPFVAIATNRPGLYPPPEVLELMNLAELFGDRDLLDAISGITLCECETADDAQKAYAEAIRLAREEGYQLFPNIWKDPSVYGPNAGSCCKYDNYSSNNPSPPPYDPYKPSY